MGVGEQLVEHLGLLVQGGQVGGAGDVAPHGAAPVLQLQGGGVVGDGGAQNGDVRGGGVGGLEGSGGVGQDQIHVLRQEAVDDGGAVGGVAGGVALLEGHAVLAQLLHQGVLEALGGGVQGGVLVLLADAHGVLAPGGLALGAFGLGGLGIFRAGAGAGRQGQCHDRRQQQCG